ncbi:MAG: glycosyltransferase family 39 protein [Elusimicrobiota bacterium]
MQKKFFPDWLIWVVVCIWGFIVLQNYYSIFSPNFDNLGIMLSFDQYLGIFNFENFLIFKHLFNIFLAGFFLFSAFAIGRWILLRVGLLFFNFLEEIVFSVGLGLGIIAYLIFFLGVLGLLYSSVIYFVVIIFSVLGVVNFKKNSPKIGFPSEKLSVFDILVLVVLGITVLINLTGALSPEIFYDSLVYHLGVTNFYKIHHKIVNMPFVFLSNLPAVASMLFTAGLLIKNEIVSKLINFSAGLLCCLAIISISIRYFRLRVGIWAVLIFYTISQVMRHSWACGTEMLLAFFGMLALYSIMNYAANEKKWLILSAVFSGLSMSVKYTGFFVMLGIIISFLIIEGVFSLKNIKNMILFGLVSAVVVSPWLIKNYVYKKNPVYPYLSNIFPKDKDSDYNKLAGFIAEAKQFDRFKIINWLKHPWDITMGKIANSDYFTPLFLYFLPILFLLGRPPPFLKFGIIYFIVIWLSWSFSTTMIRFMMPAFPVGGLIIAVYLTQNNSGKILNKFLLFVVLSACMISIYLTGWICYNRGGWKVVFGKESKESYLSSTPACGYYTAAEFVNKNLPQNAKILFIGDGRSFYFERTPVVSSAHDLTPIVEWSKKSASGKELYQQIQSEGITHIYFNLREAIRLSESYGMFQWDKKSIAVFNDFWEKYVKEIFCDEATNRIVVYEILSEKDALTLHTSPLNMMTEIVLKNRL